MASLSYRKTFFPGFTKDSRLKSVTAVPASETDTVQTPSNMNPIPRSRVPVQVGIHVKKPWTEYARIMKMDLAGPFVQASKRNKPQKVVAIREVKGCGRDLLRHLRTTTHEHVVTLYTAYFDEGSAFLVYDMMSVALNDILATPRGPLEIGEVATVCQSVISGLHHIHEDLKIAHGSLSGETILLNSTSGQIKIGMWLHGNLKRRTNMVPANIGESMLKSCPCRDFQHDLKCLGRLLRKMLEPESDFADSQVMELLRPQKGDGSAADFWKQTDSEPAAMLLQVSLQGMVG